jgi:hypothetical protein
MQPRVKLFEGAGLYDPNGVKKPSFKRGVQPWEFISFLKVLPSASINKLHENDFAYLKELMSVFVAQNNLFIIFIEGIKVEYINFVKNYLNIPVTSNEYKDIEQMINELVDVLVYRSEFVKEKNEDIVVAMMNYFSSVGGRSESIMRLGDMSLSRNIKGLTVSKRMSTRGVSRGSMSTRGSIDESTYEYEKFKFIPMYKSTLYHISDLCEPFKTYYKDYVDSRNYVDTNNRGYCASKKEFNKIIRQLS